MNKTILVLAASPRKGGNSDLLCEQFAQGAREAGHTVETVFVRDKVINYCLGCETCLSNGGKCVHKDDMAEILAKMLAADVIVLATPVYFYAMDAQLKALIDRSVARYTEITGKDFYFIVTAADKDRSMVDRAMENLRAYTACLSDAHEKGVVHGLGAWKKGEISGSPAMREARDMGRAV